MCLLKATLTQDFLQTLYFATGLQFLRLKFKTENGKYLSTF